MADINLSKAVRSNLGSLQNTAALMSKTSDRLSTGNKVNSALDNPTNFFTASSLNSRAGDLNNLMDSMANGIKTIEAANNGLTSITKTLESMQSTLRQARQDKSFQTASYTVPTTGLTSSSKLSFTGGAVGDTAAEIDLMTDAVAKVDATMSGTAAIADDATLVGTADANVGKTITLTDADGATATFTIAADSTKAALETALSAGDFTAAFNSDNELEITNTNGKNFTVSGDGASLLGLSGTSDDGVVAVDARAKTTDELVNEINNDTAINTKIRAANDNGKLRIENLSTTALTAGGVNVSGNIDGTSSGTSAAKVAGNSVRDGLSKQFNELRDQLDKLSDDASFNGINLLRGDNLKITFNETGTSSIDIKTTGNKSVNSANLGVPTTLKGTDLDSDTGIDGILDKVKTALNSVRSQSSAFGSNLSIVQNRQDFTKSMINTLETGAGNLTLADMNQEAANMMALQTRQSLASSTLSMANQADQGVLQLLR